MTNTTNRPKTTKFWNKIADKDELFIYGDICAYKFEDNDVTAKEFAADLSKCNGRNVTLHINSGGGDVFTAIAIYNCLKNYSGEVNIKIDGLAASAASLIVCAGTRVSMAHNALLMIHLPAVGLAGFFDGEELAKMQNRLAKIEDIILETYTSRIKNLSGDDLKSMIYAETWFNADEALSAGFIDEILNDDAELAFDNSANVLVVNSLRVDCGKFKNLKVENLRTEEKKMDEKTLFDKLKEFFTAQNAEAVKNEVKNAADAEIERIRTLTAAKNGTAIRDAMIDFAIKNGDDLGKIEGYLNVLKEVEAEKPTPTVEAVDAITKMIADNLSSGADGVKKTGESEISEEEQRLASIKAVVDFANGGK